MSSCSAFIARTLYTKKPNLQRCLAIFLLNRLLDIKDTLANNQITMIKTIASKKSRYLTLTLSLFCLPLFYAWHSFPWANIIQNPLSIYATLGSYIPYSDAAGYYGGAQHFLHHGQLTSFAARRPFNTLFLATRFFWLGAAIKPALVCQALICAIATFLASAVVKTRMGTRLAIGYLLANFLYIAFYLPTLLNTPLGFILGSFSFVLLLESIYYKRLFNFYIGLFVFTLALFVRAGTFFVLPLLGLWAGQYFKSDHQRINWTAVLGSSLACLMAFALNKFLIMHFAAPGAGLMSNFSWTLYGLVTGKGWLFAAKTLPQTGHSASEYHHLIYQQSLQFFLKQPLVLLKTLWSNMLHFQIYAPYSLAYFIVMGASLLMPVGSASPQRKSVICLLFCLCTVGLLLAIGVIDFRQAGPLLGLCISLHCLAYLYYLSKQSLPIAQFFLYVLIGIIASAAILWDDGRARVFAASMPLYIGAYLCTLYYFFFPAHLAEHKAANKNQTTSRLSTISLSITVFLIFITIGTAALIQSQTQPTPLSVNTHSSQCPISIKTTPNDPRMILSLQDDASNNQIDARRYLSVLKKSGIEAAMQTDLTRLAQHVINTKQPIELRLIYDKARLRYVASSPKQLDQTLVTGCPRDQEKILTKNSEITWISPNSPPALAPSYAGRQYPIR
jgi:hypothetical protein